MVTHPTASQFPPIFSDVPFQEVRSSCVDHRRVPQNRRCVFWGSATNHCIARGGRTCARQQMPHDQLGMTSTGQPSVTSPLSVTHPRYSLSVAPCVFQQWHRCTCAVSMLRPICFSNYGMVSSSHACSPVMSKTQGWELDGSKMARELQMEKVLLINDFVGTGYVMCLSHVYRCLRRRMGLHVVGCV